jgi:hypothetical protein
MPYLKGLKTSSSTHPPVCSVLTRDSIRKILGVLQDLVYIETTETRTQTRFDTYCDIHFHSCPSVSGGEVAIAICQTLGSNGQRILSEK